ncbi:MAG: DUF4058 family protein [Armatimonadaceae bacterium]
MMPNPFPGMNPYLEKRSFWSDVHTTLITGFRAALTRHLPDGYAAKIEQRVYIAQEKRSFQPDVFTVARRDRIPLPGGSESEHGGGTAVLSPATTVPVTGIPVNFEPETVRERFLEIRTTDESETLVAVIEILSPTNKEDDRGRLEYRRKQEALLESTAHLLEIDLLRSGKWVLTAPEAQTREALGPFDYLISLHTAGSGNLFHFWPIALRDPLPTVRIPLLASEGVEVNVQEVLNRAYEEAGYDRLLDYRADPDPPLLPEAAQWADTLLREKGLR